MASFYSLFSSSSGNASYIGTRQNGVLVDAGVSCRRLEQAFSKRGIPIEAVKAVLVTHSHSDHVSGLRVFLKKHPVPVYATPDTLEQLWEGQGLPETAQTRTLEGNVEIAGIRVTAFPTSHDVPGSCGYRLETPDGRSCSVCTDLGIFSPEVQQAVTGSDLVLLEANYDEQMLRNSPYPYITRQRIAGDDGHLSNESSAAAAALLVKHGTTRLILGHISRNNNTPQLAEQTVLQGLREFRRGRDYLLEVAAPEGLEKAVIF